jgi:hypothetical protein
MSSRLKVASFTVHADAGQSARWKQAAEGEGFSSVGSWLSRAADAYLKVRARAGLPVPLAWSKGVFSVQLMDGEEIRVTGMVSPPFAYFRGTSHGTDRNKGRSLVHLASGRIIATLRRSAQARALASELAPALLRGELPDAALLVERHVRDAK